MEVKLKGVHRVRKRLADGTVKTYHYAWRGGPRITSKPGTDAFIEEYTTLKRKRVLFQPQTIGALIADYQKSTKYTEREAETRRSYDHHLGIIKAKFGTMKLVALKAKGARRVFLNWHESMRDTPRAADLSMAVLRRVLSYGTDIEAVDKNPLAQSFERLSRGSRKDIVWSADQLDTMLTNGREHIRRAVLFGLWTMQRQGDLLTMRTMAAEGDRFQVVQGKTGSRVWVAIPDELRPIVDEAKEEGRGRLLVNSYGENWTSSGFQSSFRKEMKRLDLKGVTFNDLRGTGITYCYAMGVDIATIALISGHSKASVETVIRKHYLAGQEIVEAIRKART